MAYRSLERDSSYAYGSSSSCLDGVPFKISPQFLVPNRVRIDANLIRSPTHHSEEYNFEIEEGVMKWAEEREKAIERERQLQAQKLEEELRTGKVNRGPITIHDHDSDSEPEDEWLKNNSQNVEAQPTSTQTTNTTNVKPKPPPRPPPPRGPVISNSILTPTPISTASNGNKTDNGSNKPVDVTLFETEDDPFDMFERQTLNDLEELKTVFQCSNPTSVSSNVQSTDCNQQAVVSDSTNNYENVHPAGQNNYENISVRQSQLNGVGDVNGGATMNGNSLECDNGDYVTLQQGQENSRKSPQIDFNKLPPVPPRRFMGNSPPLPPIHSNVSASQPPPGQIFRPSFNNPNTGIPNPFGTDNFVNSQPPSYENVVHPDPLPIENNQPQNYGNINIQNGRVLFSKNEASLSHESLLQSTEQAQNSNYVNVAPSVPINLLSGSSKRNAKSNPDITQAVNGIQNDVFDRAPFPFSRSPPPRPSSKQSWNKYSPLPSPSGVSKSSSNSDFASPSEVDPYLRLSPEQQEVVNNLVGMGFSRPRVARAVENLGTDQKEVVDYLCNVDKLSEAGHDKYQSEMALVLFKNDKQKAEVYLNLYKQFRELGFPGEKIKDALVKFDNDGDKALDYLTT